MPEKPKGNEYITFGNRLRVRREKIDGAYFVRDELHGGDAEIIVFINGATLHINRQEYAFDDVGRFFGFWK